MFIAGALLALTACNGNGNVPTVQNQQSENLPTVHEEQVSGSLLPETSDQWTIEELGEIIVAVGTFWEDWWNLTGLFDAQQIEWFEWDEWPDYLSEKGATWGWFSPDSGLERGVRYFLLQHYTEAGINIELSRLFYPIS